MFQNSFKSLQARTPGRLSVSATLSPRSRKGSVLCSCTIPSIYRTHAASIYSCNSATGVKTRHSRDRDCSYFTYKETEMLKATCPARSPRGFNGGTWTWTQTSFLTGIWLALWEHRAGHFWVLNPETRSFHFLAAIPGTSPGCLLHLK